MANIERVTFWPSTNSTIRGNIISPEEKSGPRPGVLFLHGYDSSRQGAVERAADLVDNGANITALAIDLGGHGESVVFDGPNSHNKVPKENMSINDHLREVERCFNRLRYESSVDPERIGVVGASYGGYLAMRLATDGIHSVKSLMLRAPAIYPDGLDDTPRIDYDDEGEIYRFRTDPYQMGESEFCERVEGFEGQVWVVESGCDESIPQFVPEFYASKTQNPTHLIIGGAKHSLQSDGERALYSSYLSDWVKEL